MPPARPPAYQQCIQGPCVACVCHHTHNGLPVSTGQQNTKRLARCLHLSQHTHYIACVDTVIVCVRRHASIAESWMAVAVLSDDAALFSKASSLFVATTTNYLRWGRDPNSSTGRVLGECTETLRVGSNAGCCGLRGSHIC
jgi:hypothetical protein